MVRSSLLWLVGVMMVFGGAASSQAETGVLFHASFDEALEAQVAHASGSTLFYDDDVIRGEGRLGEAAVVPTGGALVYEGSGAAYMDQGTLSFFWQIQSDPGKTEFEIAQLSSLQRYYFCRWLRVYGGSGKFRLALHHDMDRSSDRLLGSRQSIEKGRWYHVAVTWHQAQGVALYIDGQLAGRRDEPWHFGGNLNALGLGTSKSSYTRARPATRDQAFDEVRIYDRPLTEAQVEELAQGRAVALEETEVDQALADWRRQVYGWDQPEGLPELAVGPEAEGTGVRQVGVEKATDVLRTTLAGMDGDTGRAWPGYIGYADAGNQLRIALTPGARVDVIQMRVAGKMDVRLPGRGEAKGASLLASDASYPTTAHAVLSTPVTGEGLEASGAAGEADVSGDRRGQGLLFDLRLFERVPFEGGEGEGWQAYSLGALPGTMAGDPVADRVREEFHPQDQLALVAGEGESAETLTLQGMSAVHVLGPRSQERRGLTEIVLDLALVEAGESAVPGAVQVRVIDPLNYERSMLTVDHRLVGEAEGRLRLRLDLRDLVLPPGMRPWLVLTFERGVTLDAGASQVRYRWASVEAALPEYLHDEFAMGREIFRDISEGRPWAHPPERTKWLRSLLNILNELRELAPDHERVAAYWHWVHPREAKPRVELPAVPEGTPVWASYMDRVITMCREAAHWWVENRQTPEGEFGAADGINDDTDLVQDWLALDLMRGPDPVLRHSAKIVADLSYERGMADGLSFKITDTLHMYEWGMNVQTLMAVMDYGNPVYIERLMESARQYEKLMFENDEGHLHFRSWYYGAPGITTEGRYGVDRQINALTLQPAMLLTWYNGNAYCRDVLTQWTDAMIEHTQAQAATGHKFYGADVEAKTDRTIPQRYLGIAFPDAVWASYEFTGDRRYLDFIGEAMELEMSRGRDTLLRTTSVIGRYLDEGDSQHQLEKHQAVIADPAWWIGSLHNGNYRPLAHFYAVWRGTGDRSVLDEAMRLTLNDLIWSLPMLTEAEQSTDRVWLPQRMSNRLALGDVSILRNQIFPKHAVSWEHATGRITPLVHTQSKQHLDLTVVNLESEAVQVDMRLWRLEHGRYRVTQGPESDDAVDSSGTPQEMELARYDTMPLTIPAGGAWRVTFEQVEALDDVRARADLAVCADDMEYDAATGDLTLVVHNIGAKASEPCRLKVRGADGVVHEVEVAALEAPLDLHPRRQSVTLKGIPAGTLQVAIELADGQREITLVNNAFEAVLGE